MSRPNWVLALTTVIMLVALVSIQPSSHSLDRGRIIWGADFISEPTDFIEYCVVLQEEVSRSVCRRYEELPSTLEEGAAAFTIPDSMRRGESRTVEFAVARGREPRNAIDLVDFESGRVLSFRPRIGRYMAAELSGEGFEISPEGPRQEDLFLSGAGRWSWTVQAVRAPRHVLVLTAWVKAPAPDKTLKPVWVKTVHRRVNVRVGFLLRMRDFIDDSVTEFRRLEGWVQALTALVVALGALWLAVRFFGRKAPPA